jgi:hypothetical protein
VTAAPGIDPAVVVAGDALVDLTADEVLAKANRKKTSDAEH